MSDDLNESCHLTALLLLVFRQTITAPNEEAGLACLAARADQDAMPHDWRRAVADALAAGYVQDPVRLSVGALHCTWQLELTPKGADMARRLRSAKGDLY